MSLATLVDTFNELFGKQVLMMSLFVSSDVLNACISVYLDLSLEISSTIIYLCSVLVMLFMVMLCCDLVVNESKKILVTCVNYQETIPVSSEEYCELKKLCEILELRPISFTAAKCFEINRSTVFSLMSQTLIYFTAIIQFIEPTN
ncbi:uncharacterized protein LOC132705593 [Cylas formicarius]|uniref:uncharacterized protein LOC132705593 n=1 Tax=Cylas formicarius TaxID=197179 RepID=UPI00295864DF|nr:uncharacterized protein LOC132705593 [Cylas formicarius]